MSGDSIIDHTPNEPFAVCLGYLFVCDPFIVTLADNHIASTFHLKSFSSTYLQICQEFPAQFFRTAASGDVKSQFFSEFLKYCGSFVIFTVYCSVPALRGCTMQFCALCSQLLNLIIVKSWRY